MLILFGQDSQTPRETYFQLYEATARALKAADSALNVGGPVTCMGADIVPFLDFVNSNSVPVDFVSTHVYPTDPNITAGSIRELINNTVRAVGDLKLPVFFTEFNDGLFNNPPLHDYPFAASYFVTQMARVDAALAPGKVCGRRSTMLIPLTALGSSHVVVDFFRRV